MHTDLKLLPPEAIVSTGPVDHGDWNFRPLLGPIQRSRFQLAEQLLPSTRVRRIVEIGYGSGVFMPQLARHCDELLGVDVHHRTAEVAMSLAASGVHAQLCTGSAESLPFPARFADCVVAVSALEFVQNLPAACREINRILRPGGSLVVITPGFSRILDLGLWILTRADASKDFADRRRNLVRTLLQYFRLDSEIRKPAYLNSFICMYRALRLQPLPPCEPRQ